MIEEYNPDKHYLIDKEVYAAMGFLIDAVSVLLVSPTPLQQAQRLVRVEQLFDNLVDTQEAARKSRQEE